MKTYIIPTTGRQDDAAKSLLKLRSQVSWTINGGLKSEVVSDLNSESVKKGRYWKTVQHADHQATVTNYAAVSGTGRTLYRFIFCPITAKTIKSQIKAPAGYVFFIDSMGVGVRRLSDGRDYHMLIADLRREAATADYFVAALNELDAQRNRAEQEKAEVSRNAAIFEADLATTRVTFHDSRRAGNCVAGTLAFASSKLGLGTDDVLPLNVPGVAAKILMRIGDSRAVAAVRAAWQRETLIAI